MLAKTCSRFGKNFVNTKMFVWVEKNWKVLSFDTILHIFQTFFCSKYLLFLNVSVLTSNAENIQKLAGRLAEYRAALEFWYSSGHVQCSFDFLIFFVSQNCLTRQIC